MPTAMIYIIAAVAFGGSYLVKWWMTRTYREYSGVANQYGVTGAQAAAAILQDNGLHHVKIASVEGALTDHYDPRTDVLRLSRSNFSGKSIAAMAVSAHEAGHALQDATDDFRLKLRRYLVPLAALGGRIGPMVVLAGIMTQSRGILQIGVLLMAGMMIFQLVTLPVEFDASHRAVASLERLGLSDPTQKEAVRKVLNAAAFTYVAAAATSVAYFAFLLGQTRRGSPTA